MTISVRDLGRGFRDGSLSPESHTRGCLAAIEERNPLLHCFFRVTADIALAEARKAAAEFVAGIDRGPLQGIPYAIADVIDVAGVPTTCGSRLRANHVPDASADVVERLRAAGAVLLGKTATFEFALGGPGQDSLFPPARNPWDLARTAGAVGGGAVVAAGLAAFAIAPDTGGAVRGSASLCGVAGLKPTRGQVSCNGIFPVSSSLDHCGIIAGSADDISCVLAVVVQGGSAPSPHRSTSTLPAVHGLTIGVLSGQPGIQPSMEDALRQAASAFQAHGARIKSISIEYLDCLLTAAQVIYATECFAVHRDALRDHPELFGENTRHRLIVGAFLEPDDHTRARQTAKFLGRRFDDEVMSSCDILLSPAAAGPAPLLNASAYGVAGRSGAQTLPFNITGHPAIGVPCGRSDGLPIGLQIVGQRFGDAGLLLAAEAFTTMTAGQGIGT
jgi:aspartyl-tRNA(Asn)/glutamyl-tRNA(Gln) amidotransferase subunit A